MAAAAAAWRKLRAGLIPQVTEGRRWLLIDAKKEVLGRLASKLAIVLMGKDKPTYSPNKDEGDICVVINAKHITYTGGWKLKNKVYYWHTGYIGHLKQIKLNHMIERDPTLPLRKAVFRMMPRNRLHRRRMLKLRVFADERHPFDDKPLVPWTMPPRNIRKPRIYVPRSIKLARRKLAEREAAAAAAAAESEGDGGTAQEGVDRPQ
ncbi:uncharacterized protein LOC9660601 [Selaginella moellendorffii]|uniref:uncharacterized protein LOC9660601 n=1 Tax=Selaginella moellendorffii TaxID=88036 RepID=UPI000D1CF962|nr:uncharacterized protein LOC9660601 [Selaginella moellendorffii]|eukprot:XP_002969548.2 uncharacterized protein LOC9660601 [Selaginella moellendorffii]